MTIGVDQLMKNSFVISIDKAKYDAFAESFRQAGFETVPRLIDGFKVNTDGNCPVDKHYKLPPLKYPILGNSFTHAAIVKYGKTFGLDFVCIFEDDAFPCNSAAQKLGRYLTDIPDSCNVLKLGYNMIYGSDRANAVGSKYIAGLRTWGSHAYVVFRKYYDQYMRIFEKHIVCDDAVFNEGGDTLLIGENIFIQRSLSGNTKPINRLNNPLVTSFDPEAMDLARINETLRKTKYIRAGDMLNIR